VQCAQIETIAMNRELLSQCAKPATRSLDAENEIVNAHMGNLVVSQRTSSGKKNQKGKENTADTSQAVRML
jgi:hypothetical protein